MRQVQDPITPDLWTVAKALGAAAAGRALLILNATRQETPSIAKLVGIALYEVPIICAFALLGWHISPLLNATTEEWRITATIMLAWTGQRGLDLVLQRLFPTKHPSGTERD